MSETAGTIASRICALEQLLLVAVVRGDDRARHLARGEIARLKRQLPSSARPERTGPCSRTASTPAPAH